MLPVLKKFFTLLAAAVIFSGCLKDNITPPLNIEFETAAEMIHYFEAKGDYINSAAVPSIVTAWEVNENLSEYLLLDVRKSEEYSNGHIPGAINVPKENLVNYLSDINSSQYPKIIIISRNGQASAYFTALLRLAGFSNVYSLNFGMAYWHSDFADSWREAISLIPLPGFVETEFPKDPFQKLPNMEVTNESASIEEKIKSRIKELLREDFFETSDFTESGPYAGRDIIFNKNVSIICYGSRTLYSSKLEGFAHPPGTIHFSTPEEFGDFRSTRYLQSLPTDKRIAIYSYDGNLSAFITAYLRILGYNASSINFGANAFFYNVLRSSNELFRYAFNESEIMNYSYEK